MDRPDPIDDLALLRAEIAKLRLDVNRVESLRRQLEATRDQLRRSQEAIERRDAIIREARKRIEATSRLKEQALRDAATAKRDLAESPGARLRAIARAIKRVRGRLSPKILGTKTRRRDEASHSPLATNHAWEPPTPIPARPRPRRSPASLRVAAIVGSHLRAQLAPECALTTFGAEGWQEVLEDARPHMLLVESDPNANSGSWQRQLQEDGDLDPFRAVIEWFRRNQIPTVFWNTADPLGLERWLPIAALHDHVLSVDADAVARSAARGVLGMANIGHLPEGVQPRTFRPESAGRAVRACFVLTDDHVADARLWGNARSLLEELDELGIDVYAHSSTTPAAPGPHFQPLAEPLWALYRRYAVAISCPARGDAKGKIPRRVLEMLASGVAVVALTSPDVSLHLGSVVTTVATPHEARDVVSELFEHEAKRARIAAESLSFVLRAHTTTHRLAAIASAAGLPTDPDYERRVAALVLADQSGDAEAALGALSSQSHAPDEIIVGTKADPSDLHEVLRDISGLRVRIVRQDGGTSLQRVQELARMASVPWVFLSTADAAPDELEPLILRAPYVGADVVARVTTGGAASRITDEVIPFPVVAKRELVAERGWTEDAGVLQGWAREGIRIYAIEPSP
jgi:hypothetical protein